MKKWAEITSLPARSRSKLLSQEMRDAGCENEVDIIKATDFDFEAILKESVDNYDQIRISGSVCEMIHKLDLFTSHSSYSTPKFTMPSTMVPLKSADALLKIGDSWKPHNFLVDGFRASIVRDVKAVDTSGSVFVVGVTCETRGVVATLARMGFRQFIISDLNDEKGQAFVEEINQSYFGSRFQFVDRHLITQLPSVNTVAINTLHLGEDEGVLSELYYFNFLKPGGLWVDLAILPPNKELENEARAVGAIVESGYRVAAWTDLEWARVAFGVEISIDSYFGSLELMGASKTT